MSVEQYSDKMWVKIVDQNEIPLVGGFQFPNHCEIKYGNLYMLKKGALSGSPQARLNFYSTVSMDNLIFSSSWRALSAIDGLSGASSWLGWVRFDFDRQNINKNLTYYVGLEFSSYTPNLSTESFYIGFRLDGPDYAYASDTKIHKQGKIEFYTMQNIDWSGG